jgi:dienelactone hydrolase
MPLYDEVGRHSEGVGRNADARLVSVPADGVQLEGELALPESPRGVVVFVHGSGSSRDSPRNRYVAHSLRVEARVGTLLFDLLSKAEEQEDLRTGGALRFDIERLAGRVEAATQWLRGQPATRRLRVGYFGASTGAAAALVAAARRPDEASVIVSRGGRPDLAGPEVLARVRAPTLLIVGGEDTPTLDTNREALANFRVDSSLEVVPNASHLFEEPGALDQVVQRASAWFSRHLSQSPQEQPMAR